MIGAMAYKENIADRKEGPRINTTRTMAKFIVQVLLDSVALGIQPTLVPKIREDGGRGRGRMGGSKRGKIDEGNA